MKKMILGAALALTVTTALSAQAADSASPWTSFYAGINLGYGFGGSDNVHTDGQAAPNIANIAGGARPGFVKMDRNGFTGGVQVGYDYQEGNFLVGVVTDIDYTRFRDDVNVGTAQLNTHLPLNNRFQAKLDELGTLRGKIGWANDQLAVYGTGGLAYGKTKQSVDMFGPAPAQLTQFSGSESRTKTGYVVGAGIEYALTTNLSLSGEYLYYNLGRNTLNVAVIPGNGGAGTGYNSHFKFDGQVVRVGLNYRFK